MLFLNIHGVDCFYKKGLTFFWLVVAGLSFCLSGCGQKGSPQPPQRPLPPAVEDLSYAVSNLIVELTWTVPGIESRKASAPATVRVLRGRLTAEEASCQNCPIRYSVSADIPVDQKRSESAKPKKMNYTETVEPGYHYLYKVIVVDEYGISGKDSNLIQFDLPSN